MPLPWEEYLKRIQGFEGNPNSPGFATPKWDVRQHSIGYGTRYRPGQDTSREGLERAFGDEIGSAAGQVDRFAPNLPTGRKAALTSLTYNAGPKWMNAGLGDAVKRGDWEDARKRFLQYTSPDPRYQRGLANRRQQEAGWLADEAPGGQLPQAPMGVGAPAIMASARDTPAEWGPRSSLGAGAQPPGGLMSVIQGLLGGQAAAQPPAAAPEQFGPPASLMAPPMDVGQPDMAPGPGGIAPPPEQPTPFPPLHDPSAFGGGQLPEVPGIATTPVAPQLPGVTSSRPPPPEPPPPPPTRTGEQYGPPTPQGGGMAPARGGGGLYDYIAGGAQGGFGGLLQSLNAGLGSRGVSMALPLAFGQAGAQSAAAGQGAHELAIREAMHGREQTKFGQEQEGYQARRRAWEGAFPGGQPNPNHPLLKGLPPGIPEVIQGMGQEEGIKALGTFQMADASKRADLVREMERMRLIQQEAEGIGGQQPTGGAPAPAPAAAAPMGSFAGAGIGGAMPGVDYTPPPALAPQITSPGAPARAPAAGRGPAGVDVMDPETARMQRQAEVFDRWKMRSEPLEKEIERRRKPQVEYATKRAAQQAEQEESKPQARLATTGLIDKLNSTEALTTKLHDDPNLWWTTGNLSSKDSEGKQRPMAGFRFSAESRATEADMNTLVAKVGLDTLREMREGAKTGASGLGGTSDTEINMLSNALTALKDPSISTEAYQQNLRLVREVVGNVRERMMQHWREKYGEEFRPTAPFATYPTKSAAQEKAEETKAARKARKEGLTPNDKMKRGGWDIERLD